MKSTEAGLFTIVTGAERSDFGVADGSHKNVDMRTEEKWVDANLMELELINIPEQTVLGSHGYLKPVGTACSGTQSILCHM